MIKLIETYEVKVVVLNVSHDHLKFVFAVHHSLLHQLKGLGNKLQLVYYFLQSHLHFWLQLSVRHTLDHLLGWEKMLITNLSFVFDRVVKNAGLGLLLGQLGLIYLIQIKLLNYTYLFG